MTGHRPTRIGDRIREELSRLIRELRDPRVGFVTVTEVEITTDLRHARVFVSTLADQAEVSLAGLERARPFLRRGLARTAGLRHTPELHFVLDTTLETGARVEEILSGLDIPPEDESA